MKKVIITLVLLSSALFAKEGVVTTTFDIEKGLSAIKVYQKPALLCFIASDDEPNLFDELLMKSAFFEQIQKRFAFIVLDFPSLNMQSKETIEINDRYRQKYCVTSFPTLIMIDPDQNEVTRLRFEGEEVESFARKLDHQYAEYQALCRFDDHFKEGYQRALALGAPKLIDHFMEGGLASKEKGYFLIEKYVEMAMEGKRSSIEARKLRRQLLRLQGEELEQAKMRIALCDFQELHTSKPNVAANKVYRLLENGRLSEQNTTLLSRLLANHFMGEKDFLTAKRFAERLTNAQSLITQAEGQALLKAIGKAEDRRP